MHVNTRYELQIFSVWIHMDTKTDLFKMTYLMVLICMFWSILFNWKQDQTVKQTPVLPSLPSLSFSLFKWLSALHRFTSWASDTNLTTAPLQSFLSLYILDSSTCLLTFLSFPLYSTSVRRRHVERNISFFHFAGLIVQLKSTKYDKLLIF